MRMATSHCVSFIFQVPDSREDWGATVIYSLALTTQLKNGQRTEQAFPPTKICICPVDRQKTAQYHTIGGCNPEHWRPFHIHHDGYYKKIMLEGCEEIEVHEVLMVMKNYIAIIFFKYGAQVW